MTRNHQADRLTIEKWTRDCLDVRFLRQRKFLDDDWVTIEGTFKWPRIARLRIARYLVVLDIRGRSNPQHIRVSWTPVHLGGERPWMHCPHCQTRVARLYAGLGGYFCRACIGNPPYASQQLSAQGRAHYQACKLRLLLEGERAAFNAISRAPAQYASAHLRSAQTRRDEPGSRAVETDAEAIPGLCEPRCVYRLSAFCADWHNVEINWQLATAAKVEGCSRNVHVAAFFFREGWVIAIAILSSTFDPH